MKHIRNSFYLVSLGCAKNLVDSESMVSLMESRGLVRSTNPEKAKFLIVNTCGFIQSARQETTEVIRDLADHKKPGQLLIAAGCMTERYRSSMLELSSGIDGMLGTRRWMDILDVITRLQDQHQSLPLIHFPVTKSIGRDDKGVRAIAVQGKSSYLKIADGCRRPCAYCAIPLIKGTLVSRPPERIIRDAKALEAMGVKEINLIAQDITDYGHDLGLQDGLVTLLRELTLAIPKVPWLRLLYTFPGYVSNDLIDLMSNHDQILPYLDMPLQHADKNVLQSMQRPSNIKWVKDTIEKMRKKMPDLSLRTTFIVGYPSEDDKAFQNLMDFVEEIRFDHIGAFTYSFEKGTPAETLGDPIPPEVKEERISALMAAQAQISTEINQSQIGKRMDVLIEGQDKEQNILIGRSKRDAPEIDGLMIVEGKGEIGDLLPVRINGALTHDLIGTVETIS